MSEAITSALSNMRPQLAKMVEKETGAKSVSTETLILYQSHSRKIITHYLELFKLRDEDDINWANFAEWFLARQDLKYSTWKVYRAALSDHLERIPSDDAAVALSLIHSTEGLSNKDDEYGFDSYRIKYIDSNDFDRILYHCSRYPSQTNYQLATYLRANVRIGLRPVEFLTSEIRAIADQNAPNGRQVWLFVCNAKYSRGRANGPIRLMDLSAMDDYAVSAIRDCIEVVKLQDQITGYDLWLRNLNKAFHRISDSPKSIVTTRYNAYSARHQAIANWKSMYDPITVPPWRGMPCRLQPASTMEARSTPGLRSA